jgi:hypothetical protein
MKNSLMGAFKLAIVLVSYFLYPDFKGIFEKSYNHKTLHLLDILAFNLILILPTYRFKGQNYLNSGTKVISYWRRKICTKR